jgi:acetolactate synthase-1/3 small subunit
MTTEATPGRAAAQSSAAAPNPTPAAAPAHTAPPARALPGGGKQQLHRLVAIVVDKPGVLNRVASLMRARNFNIDSLAVSRTDRPGLSRMTISLHGDDIAVEQVTKQLYRLIDVLKVQDVTEEATVEHELALIKVRVADGNRADVLKLIELTRGRVLDVSAESVIAEISGSEADVDNFIECVRDFGIKELVRTGAVVMARGSGSIEEAVKK